MRRKKFTTETQRTRRKTTGFLSALRVSVVSFLIFGAVTRAQNPTPTNGTLKKANARPAAAPKPKSDPFDGASIEEMSGQCVTVETEEGVIVVDMLSAIETETDRSFLILATTG